MQFFLLSSEARLFILCFLRGEKMSKKRNEIYPSPFNLLLNFRIFFSEKMFRFAQHDEEYLLSYSLTSFSEIFSNSQKFSYTFLTAIFPSWPIELITTLILSQILKLFFNPSGYFCPSWDTCASPSLFFGSLTKIP